MAICALLGVLIEKLAYRPLRGRSTLTALITAIGVSLLLQNLGQRNLRLPTRSRFRCCFHSTTSSSTVVS